MIGNSFHAALHQSLVNTFYILNAVHKHHALFTFQPTLLVRRLQHFHKLLHAFLLCFYLVPLSCLCQSVMFGIVHIFRLDSARIGKLPLEVRIDALQSHIWQSRRTKDMLCLFVAVTKIRLQSIRSSKTHQDIFESPDVTTIEEHVRFVHNQGSNICKQINVFGFESEWAECRGSSNDNIYRRFASTQPHRISKGFKIEWLIDTARHDGHSHNFRRICFFFFIGGRHRFQLFQQVCSRRSPHKRLSNRSTT
mmetsp:Transcript_10562/g.19351  ORF Transcript_10562/g.19351 Transcript_10562/m.19351 type:complete len:251 (-) Transcript_10562:122-874(-)